MSDQLRMQATVDDKATGPLRKIREELHAFKETEGMKSLKENVKGLREHMEGLSKGSVAAGAGIGGLGIAALAGTVSVGELVKTFKELADRAADLKQLSRETGLTVDQVNQLQHVAERFHVAPEKMGAALGVLSDHMVDFKRQTGDLYTSLARQRPNIAKQLLGDNPEQQIRDIFKFLDQIPNEKVRQRWAHDFFGDGDITRLLSDGFKGFSEAQEEAAKNLPKITADYQRQAEEFHKSILEFNDSIEKLETKAGPAIFKELKLAADDFRQVFENIQKVAEWFQAHKDHVVRDGAKAAGDYLDKSVGEAAQTFGNTWRHRFHMMHQNAIEHEGEDGNALRKSDAMPAGLLHRSAFITGFGDIGTDGGLSKAVKDGVLAAFREWATQKDPPNSGGAGSGLQNASLETWDGSGGTGQGGGSGGTLGRGGSGSRSWRNNNPGNVVYGAFAKQHGAIGTDGKFAIFPDYKTGRAADEALLFGSKAYAGLNVGQAISKYAPPSENNTAGYIRSLGIDPSTPLSSLNAQQRSAMLDRIQGIEGWRPGGGLGAVGKGDWVGLAEHMFGANGAQAAAMLHSKMTPGEWCADFVNGVLKASGGHGVNGSLAATFRDWGRQVAVNDAQRGDIILERHGNRIGHVGIATGPAVRDAHGNIVGVPMISGNYGHKVNTNLEKLGDIAGMRRGERPSLWERAGAAGMLGGNGQTVTHKGGAEITIHGLPQGTGVRSRTEGLINSVRLNRSSTMPDLRWT